jgi:hypothetical protein
MVVIYQLSIVAEIPCFGAMITKVWLLREQFEEKNKQLQEIFHGRIDLSWISDVDLWNIASYMSRSLEREIGAVCVCFS